MTLLFSLSIWGGFDLSIDEVAEALTIYKFESLASILVMRSSPHPDVCFVAVTFFTELSCHLAAWELLCWDIDLGRLCYI